MEKVNVEVKVTLVSGASIGLTANQYNQINNFVSSILFTEKVQEKKTYTKKSGLRRWTPEEDALLLPLLSMTDKKDKMKYYRKIAGQLRRDKASMYTRLFKLKKQNPTNSQPISEIPVKSWL